MPKKPPPPDPKTCASCAFFAANQTDDYGYCRRFPPLIYHDGENANSASPVTSIIDWCGEYQRRTH